MTLSFLKPPVKIEADEPVATRHANGSPEGLAPGYVLNAGEGPALWFMEALFTLKARGLDTNNQFSVVEQLAPKGFAAPGHTHSNTTEAFYVLEGEMDFCVGETVFTGVKAGSFVYVPHSTRHEFRVISEHAKFLLVTTPGGFEKYFEALSSPATEYKLPPPEHRQLSFEEVMTAKRKWGAMPSNDGSLLPPIEHGHDHTAHSDNRHMQNFDPSRDHGHTHEHDHGDGHDHTH